MQVQQMRTRMDFTVHTEALRSLQESQVERRRIEMSYLSTKSEKKSLIRCLEIGVILAIAAIAMSSFAEDLPPAPGIAPMAVSVARRPIVVTFLSNNLNRSLIAGDFTARLLDATSTRYYEKHDLGHEIGEPAFIAHSYKTQLPVSLGEAAVNTMIASKLWSHHHERLARVVMMTDIGVESLTDLHNYTLKKSVRK